MTLSYLIFNEFASEFSSVQVNPSLLITDATTNDKFIKLDFKLIKRADSTAKIAPPESFTSPPVIEYPLDQPEMFVCLDLAANGRVCGQLVDSFEALQLHRANGTRFGGGHGALTIASLAMTNQCFNCRAILAARMSATQHVRNAYFLFSAAPV